MSNRNHQSQEVNFLKASEFVYSLYLSKAYQGNQNRFGKTYVCSDKTVIHRPNHGLVHSIRKAGYSTEVIKFLKAHAIADKDKYNFNQHELQAIKLALLFSVVGREDEAGFSKSPEAYQRYLDNSATAFAEYCRRENILNEEYIARFSKILRAKHDDKNTDAARIVIFMCHELDLLRCFPPDTIQTHLAKLKAYCSDNRAFTQLVLYAQRCIEGTGDSLRTKFQGHQGRILKPFNIFNLRLSTQAPWFCYKQRDDHLFKSCSTDVNACLDALQAIEKPKDFSSIKHFDNQSRHEQAQTALRLIKKTQAAIRLVGLEPLEEDGFAFEMRLLCDPKYFRPIRINHRDKNPANRLQYQDQLFNRTLHRDYKDYIPLAKQEAINCSPDITEYYHGPSVDNYFEHMGPSWHFWDLRKGTQPIIRKIHREEDRGKPKNTIFTKKLAFSLLRPDGKCNHFEGKTSARLNYTPVGMLYDINQMHLKGQRYIWSGDVCSSSRFWTGDHAVKPGIQGNDFDALGKNIDHRGSGITLKCLQHELQEDVRQKSSVRPRNEMLLGASISSLKALFASKDTLESRLLALLAACRLKEDYGLSRPILVIDGSKTPYEYTDSMVQKDLQHLYQKKPNPLFSAFSTMLSMQNTSLQNNFIKGIMSIAGRTLILPLDDKTESKQVSMRPLIIGYELIMLLPLSVIAFLSGAALCVYSLVAALIAVILTPAVGLQSSLKWVFLPLSKLAKRLIYPSRKEPDTIPQEFMSSLIREESYFPLNEDIKLHCVTFEPKLPGNAQQEKHIIYINGKDILWQDRDWQYRMQRDAQNLNCKVHAFNMPGMGKSEGQIESINDLTEAAYAYSRRLIDSGVNPENILLKGHSLGGFIATKTAARLHGEEKKVRLFNERSFSSLENVFLARVAFTRFAPNIYRPIIRFFLYLAGWQANAEAEWNKIPDDYKSYTLIQGRGDDKSEKRYDGVISDFAALHNGKTVKASRKEEKATLRKLAGKGGIAYAKERLALIKARKLVKKNENCVERNGLALGSHNLDLANMQCRGMRKRSGADFFEHYYKKKPGVDKVVLWVFQQMDLGELCETEQTIEMLLPSYPYEKSPEMLQSAKEELYRLCDLGCAFFP